MKRLIEMRGEDGGKWRRIWEMNEYWVGMIYDEEEMEEEEIMKKEWKYEEVMEIRKEVKKKEIKKDFKGKKMEMIEREKMKI